MLSWTLCRRSCGFVSAETVPYRTEDNSRRVKLSFYYYLEKKRKSGRSETKNFQKFFECGKCGEFMSFKNTQSYKELQSDWRWIHSMDPEAAAAADQWIQEHPDEWKELERVLYYSEANFHKRVALDSLEEAEMKQPISYNPEAFLPEEVRNAIYDDMRWFDRAKYLPEGSEEDALIYLNAQLVEGLHELTELQREILFRTVINCESTESVAQDKDCSARNIRDIRARALKHLRSKITRHGGWGELGASTVILFVMLAIGAVAYVCKDVVWPSWVENVGGAIIAILVIFLRDFGDTSPKTLFMSLTSECISCV